MSTDEQIAHLRRLMEKATPRYSICDILPHCDALLQMHDTDGRMCRSVQLPRKEVEAIVAMRNALPAILDRLEKLEAVAAFARRVSQFDWSTNDDDAVGTIDAMSEALAKLVGQSTKIAGPPASIPRKGTL